MRIEKSLLIQRLLLVWFWVMTCTGFINDEFLGSNPGVRSASLLFADAALVLLALWTLREKWDIAIIVSYAIISCWSTCVFNGLSFMVWINGSRVFFGILFVIPVLRYFWQSKYRYERFIKEVDRTLFVFLCVQAACIAWQFVRYGAGDKVGGSLGYNFSGVTSFAIYAISFYLIQKRIDNNHFIYSLKQNWYLIALLIPTFFNETKISFFLIALYFFFLVKIDRKWIGRMAFIIPVALLVGGIGLTIYLDTVKNPFGDLDVVEYLAGQDLEYEEGAAEHHSLNSDDKYDVPRVAKLGFLKGILEDSPRNLYSGFGVGVYKGGTNMSLNPFAETYDWLVQGTSPYLFHVTLQLGLVGLIWSIVVFTSFFIRTCGIASERNVNMQLMFLSYIMIMTIYSDYWSNLAFCFIMLLYVCLSWKVPDSPEEVVSAAS